MSEVNGMSEQKEGELPQSLAHWVAEREQNCLRLAERKTGEDRIGWLEDADYFSQLRASLAREAALTAQVEELGEQSEGWYKATEKAEAELATAKGAISAQTEREADAGARCGLPIEFHGCDWPDAVADEVIALKAELAALREGAKWMPVSQELPPMKRQVRIFDEVEGVVCGFRSEYKGQMVYFQYPNLRLLKNVTHHMPLLMFPDPPQRILDAGKGEG